MLVVKDVNGGLVALPEIIVTISNGERSLEKKMNMCRQIPKNRPRWVKPKKWIFVQFSPHLGPFEVIQPSPYFDDPAIVEPKSSYSRVTFLYFSRYKDRILDVSIVAAPDLPVVYRGGMLHIQRYSPSGQTPFQLSQGAALLASVRLQDVMNDGEATRPIGQRLEDTVQASKKT